MNQQRSFRAIGRALASRNYRLFFFGQSVSLIGTWMQQVAMMWLVYQRTGSAFLLGLVGFASQIPAFLLAPLAGVLIDRWDRRRTLLGTQAGALLQAVLMLALAAATGLPTSYTIAGILALSVFLGTVNALDTPARQAFLVQMIENREDLGNAIALNSSMFNAARLIGPALAGFLIDAAGEWTCFLLNALSYVAVLAALLAMRVETQRPARTSVVQGFAEGFRYAFGFAPIRVLLVQLGLVSFAAMPLQVLMPVFATDILGGGPHTLGLLTGASGLGALAGALLLASRRTVLGLGRQIAAAGLLFGGAMIGFGFSQTLGLSLAILLLAGFAMIVQMAASNTVLQTIVAEDKRGRVMAFYSMAFMGMAPLGSLAAGAIAGRLGAPLTVQLGGALALVVAALFALRLPALREAIRPIYREAGILPEISTGIDAATELRVPPED